MSSAMSSSVNGEW
ncbi:hypothetical protein HaLaN_16130 [Haematococcus lacustris]|uniref:Uncharacterized protein n=1 Tax=Haematococcus lacustris TaxID=44745 RepID=A0A699ZL10_HAELA|nr:hypothetical protein HaLaN_16130 [Haematococcus lacustris]